MKQKSNNQISVGGASILLILAVFALTIFAVLSLKASLHEVKMTERSRDAIQNYYRADSKAEEYYMRLSEMWTGNVPFNENSIKKQIQQLKQLTIDERLHILTYQVSIDYNKAIEVSIAIPKNQEKKLEIISWRMVSIKEQEYDVENQEDVWNGVINE